jgi:enamine deaminase RidA (YjgF/YER057c/UK114 family)
MKIERRLRELGIDLPDAPGPAGNYRPWTQAGNLLFVSGQLPFERGVLLYTGKVGSDLREADGRKAARLCALNVLAQIRTAAGTFDRLEGLVRVDGLVNSAPGWTHQHKVIDGASDFFVQVLGDKANHARSAAGVTELPLNAAVELVVIARLGGGR